jgi:hypothetical protein
VLSEQLERMLGESDALLYHDELAPLSTPFYFHEFIEHAAAHGLQFLSEAVLADSQKREVPDVRWWSRPRRRCGARSGRTA